MYVGQEYCNSKHEPNAPMAPRHFVTLNQIDVNNFKIWIISASSLYKLLARSDKSDVEYKYLVYNGLAT